ncbi:MAG: hypothetical protein Q9225_001767, partial [Loekoesia sp. 1 TL-2023]
MRQLVDITLAASIPTLILVHLICAPYTKVEESFNIQATHDILNYGVWDIAFPSKSAGLQLKDHYDHLTFTGPPELSLVFGMLYAFSIIAIASQKPLEEVLRIVTLALARLLPRVQNSSGAQTNDPQTFLTIVTITGIVFRSELALLLIPHTLLFLLTRRLSPTSIITSGLVGALIGLSLTVPIDSIFWQRFPLWPELSAFSYNILHSQSSNWGTSSWHFYFTSALPRLLFNPVTYILCIPLTFSQPALRRPVAELILPNLVFVVLYSIQPHKEWRFIIYVVPPLLTAAALGANWIWTRRAKAAVFSVLSLALIASVIASFSASACMLAVSRLSYPGAEALHSLHALVSLHHAQYPNEYRTAVLNVHMDTLACMTGVTRFLQLPPPPLADLSTTEKNGTSGLFWVYDKTEDEETLLDPLFWERFDWVLAERPERVIGRWEIVETVEGYGGMRIVRPRDEYGERHRANLRIRDTWSLLKERDWEGLISLLE